MTETGHRVLIAGLGDVATTHLKVLGQMPGVEVVAGVDLRPRPDIRYRGQPLPVYQSLRDAVRHHEADIVVVATPTPSHAGVCTEVAELLPTASILVEKPAADNLDDARHVLRDIGSRQPVDVAYHMAFAPEVLWGLRTVEADRFLGQPVSAEMSFADPYQEDFESAAERLGSSWIDSGINALSILRRFITRTERTSLRHIGELSHSVFEAHINCQADGHDLDAFILTRWDVTDPAKTTRVRYSSGTELVMDHTAVAAYLLVDGKIKDVFGLSSRIPRRERHYRALYQSWLVDQRQIASMQDHLLLHELLLWPVDTS